MGGHATEISKLRLLSLSRFTPIDTRSYMSLEQNAMFSSRVPSGRVSRPCKVSPVQLATGLDGTEHLPRADRRVRQHERILAATRLLWCREQALPTVRSLARELGVAPSSVLRPFGDLYALYAEVIRQERAALDDALCTEGDTHVWVDVVIDRIIELTSTDPSLARLPAYVVACTSRSTSTSVPHVDHAFATGLVLHALAGLADVEGINHCMAIDQLRPALYQLAEAGQRRACGGALDAA